MPGSVPECCPLPSAVLGWLQSWFQVVSSHPGVHQLPPSPGIAPWMDFWSGGLLLGHHPPTVGRAQDGSTVGTSAEWWVLWPHGQGHGWGGPVPPARSRLKEPGRGRAAAPKDPASTAPQAAGPGRAPGAAGRAGLCCPQSTAAGCRARAKHRQSRQSTGSRQRACKMHTEISYCAGSAQANCRQDCSGIVGRGRVGESPSLLASGLVPDLPRGSTVPVALWRAQMLPGLAAPWQGG